MCECTCTSCLGTGCSARPPQHSPWLTPTGWMAFSPFSSFPAPDLWITSVCPWVSCLPCRASFYLFGKRGGPSGPTYSKELSRGALWQWGPQRTTFGFRCAFSLPEDRSPPWFQGFSMLPCSTPADPLGQDGWVQPQVLSGETEVQTVFYGGVL